MHLTTKLFFTATLLAGNLFASFAGDVTLKITKKYINLPVSHQVLIDFLQSGRLPFIADAKCLSFPGRDIAEYPVVGFLCIGDMP